MSRSFSPVGYGLLPISVFALALYLFAGYPTKSYAFEEVVATVPAHWTIEAGAYESYAFVFRSDGDIEVSGATHQVVGTWQKTESGISLDFPDTEATLHDLSGEWDWRYVAPNRMKWSKGSMSALYWQADVARPVQP